MRQVVRGRRFRACIDGDDDFVEEFCLTGEGIEWRRRDAPAAPDATAATAAHSAANTAPGAELCTAAPRDDAGGDSAASEDGARTPPLAAEERQGEERGEEGGEERGEERGEEGASEEAEEGMSADAIRQRMREVLKLDGGLGGDGGLGWRRSGRSRQAQSIYIYIYIA